MVFIKKMEREEINRKLVHLSSITYPILYLFVFSKQIMLLITGLIFVAVSFTDVIRLYSPKVNQIFNKYLKYFIREKEKRGFTGSTYFMLGVFLTILFFPQKIAITAIAVLVICDTCASVVGILYGKTKIIGNKSLQGFLAFLISAFCISFASCYYFNLPLFPAFIASVGASIFELISSKIKCDDNLLIPISYSVLFVVFYV